MIIDLILDRKDGKIYNPFEFYADVVKYESTFGYEFSISDALKEQNEARTKAALCEYIFTQGYNLEIIEYIVSTVWTKADNQ